MVLGNPMVDHKVIAPLPGTTVPAAEEEIRKTAAAAGRKPPHRDLRKQGDGYCYSSGFQPISKVIFTWAASSWSF